MARILLADDEDGFRRSLRSALESAGHSVKECSNGSEASEALRANSFDVVLTDLRMPGADGIELLKEAAQRLPDSILIVTTAYGSLDNAIEALRIGAHDFLLKPIRLEAILRKVSLLLEHQAALSENRFLRGRLELETPSTGLVGNTPAIQEVHRLIARVAPTDSIVLVHGETGTGKELVARAVHQASPGCNNPFVAINCGSIPESLLESEIFGHEKGSFTGADRMKRGLFEVAGSGTILLDEIGEMPEPLQPKLLRAVETREIMRVGSTTPIPIQARIIAATHRDLERMTKEGGFRSDLYYRLNVFTIFIPPLRERPQDVGPIAGHLLERLGARMGRSGVSLDPEVLRLLEKYRWPGNVRELANILERALILTDGSRIRLADVPGFLSSEAAPSVDDFKTARRAWERAHAIRILAKHGGDKKRAAEAMGIDVSSLYRKLE